MVGAIELAGTETGAGEGADGGGEADEETRRERESVLSQAYTQGGGGVGWCGCLLLPLSLLSSNSEAGSVEQGKSNASEDG